MPSELRPLLTYLAAFDKVTVAFSGGVDSSLLLAAAVRALGRERVLGVVGYSALHPRREIEEARRLAELIGARTRFIATDELKHQSFRENPPERCYICKKLLLGKILEVANNWGCETVLEGSNSDDLGDYRPGLEAVRQLHIKSPFLDLKLDKADIRHLSHRLDLPTWNKPAFACLASRIPYGSPISLERLQRIEKAEDQLHRQGFRQFRVRDFDYECRIEIETDDFARLLDDRNREAIIRTCTTLGYHTISLDLKGYCRGSLNPDGCRPGATATQNPD